MIATTATEQAMGEVASESKPQRRTPWWQTALRVGISLALVAYVLEQIDLTSTARIVLSGNAVLLALAWALFVGARYLAAFRWYALLHGRHPEVTFRRLSRLVLTTSFLGYFLPGGGTEAMRAVSASRATGDPALVVASMLVERLTATLALFLLVLVGVAWAPLELPKLLLPLTWAALLALLGFSVLLMLPWPRRVFADLMHRVKLGGLSRRADKLLASLDSYKDQPKLLVASLFVGIFFQLMRVIPVAVIGAGLGLKVPLVYYLVIVPIIFFIVMLPISFGGLGLREAGYVHFLAAVGVTADAAVGLSLMTYVLQILASVVGAWVYARHGLGMTSKR
ncbi:MAG: lysylphosphatidylglycerol synthase transmembrane domain-containing protein [Geminicoccaceae bacterium]